jgi:hypothetical protein
MNGLWNTIWDLSTDPSVSSAKVDGEHSETFLNLLPALVTMKFEDIDPNVKYLVLTVLLLLPVAAAHNLTVPEQGRSFAMCDVSIDCQGFEAGNTCIGIESRGVSCVDPVNASEYRRVEAECGLDAQAICNEDPSLEGLQWTQSDNASYEGTRCSEWADQDERIDLLKCEQTFNDISQWSGTDGR